MNKNFLLLACITILAACSSKSDSEIKTLDVHEHPSENSIVIEKKTENFSAFIDTILFGTPMSAIPEYMKSTPFTFLGENEGRMNFEGEDENDVNHFVSFATYHDNELHQYAYNLDFKKNNGKLVSDYQQKLLNQMTKIFGDEYDTGYDSTGNHVVDWVMEWGEVSLTHGVDFILVEIRE